MRSIAFSIALLATNAFLPAAFAAGTGHAMIEANALMATEGQEAGRAPYSPGHGGAFKASDHVFVKSALAVDFTYRQASVTLPLFRGVSPSDSDEFYIIYRRIGF